MAVHWNCGECTAYKKLIAEDHDEDSDEWDSFNTLMESLIWGLMVTGFPAKSEWKINEDNWEEVFRRLHIVERVAGAYRIAHTETGKKPLYFTAAEVHSMIGLAVNAGNKTRGEFRKWIDDRSIDNANAELKQFHKDHEQAGQSDPKERLNGH